MYGEHVRLKYRDIDDLMTYEFVFFDYGDDEESWCIYIISDIDYDTRPSDCHSAHWLKNEDESFRYICWEGEITSFEDALTIASVWADCTTRYIESLIDAAMSGDSLTVRSFKSVIEGYLAPVFARAEVVENRTYRLEGTLEEPQMIAENRAR